MPLLRNRDDAADLNDRLTAFFDASQGQRAQVLRQIFVEMLDFASASGSVSLARAPRSVSLPESAERIASRDGVQVAFVALTTADSDRVRKAEASVAAKLINDTLQGDLLLMMMNSSGSQLHVIWPSFAGTTPTLRRMVVERYLSRRTVVGQLSDLYWRYTDSKDLRGALENAFNVEAVTRAFFDEYRRIFDNAMSQVKGFESGVEELEAKRVFVQTLFNRLMFICFLSRKGWLEFQGENDYLNALWKDYESNQDGKQNFYTNRLSPLFFAGLNNPQSRDLNRNNPVLHGLIGDIRFLNGGLFDKTPEDERSGIEVNDKAIEPILTKLFDRFNFTVMESTPFDIEIAVDPEMLGKVFEELVTGRHESGSYYTPKPVVSFMAREALKGFLATACPAESRTAIERFVDGHNPEGLRDAEAILAALKRVRVCDPACGSGAYLLGMLHELLDLRQALFATRGLDSRTVFDRKLEIIENSLYGVDIDPFAVNIAMLRLWLSLVVDYDGRVEDLPPLPNLDFKVEAGDSLTAPNPQAAEQQAFRDEFVRRFQEKKAAYMRASGDQKTALRKEIEDIRAEIAQWTRGKAAVVGFDWAVEFAEVFADGGFDIAIANPPYRRQEGLATRKEDLKKLYPDVFVSTADYHVYFFARSVQLLRDGGELSFITSNKYMRAAYGEKIREFLPGALTLGRVVDFGDLPVFKAAAYPAVVVGRKTSPAEGHTLRVADLAIPVRRALQKEGKPMNVETVSRSMEQLGQFLEDSGVSGYPQVLLKKTGWVLEDSKLVGLFYRLMNSGTPLGEFVKGRMYRGVLTGLNEAFVIDEAKRRELIAVDSRSAELIKPWLRGRDIKRWQAEWRGLYVIAIQNSNDKDARNPWSRATTEADARRIFRRAYPAIHEHVSQREVPLRKRQDQGQWWWELRACAYYRNFEKPKVVWPDITKTMRFAWDETGAFTDTTTFISPSLDRGLLVLLNSTVIKLLLTFLTYSLRGGFLRLKRQYIEQLPIPNLETGLTAEMKSIASSQDDHLLDPLAYKAFKLSPSDQLLLEEWRQGTETLEPLLEASPVADEDD